MTQMFYDEWVEKLRKGGLGDAESLIISKGDLTVLLKLLDIEQVVKVEDGANMLDFYENGKAPFSLFYKELVQFIYQAS